MIERVRLELIREPITWESGMTTRGYFKCYPFGLAKCAHCGKTLVGEGLIYDATQYLTHLKSMVKKVTSIRKKYVVLHNVVAFCPPCLPSDKVCHRVIFCAKE